VTDLTRIICVDLCVCVYPLNVYHSVIVLVFALPGSSSMLFNIISLYLLLVPYYIYNTMLLEEECLSVSQPTSMRILSR